MKKFILTGLILLVGWLGFAYASAAWTRGQFNREVESLLQSPRDMTETSLASLILNKAKEFGMDVRPEDIQIRIGPTDRKTVTSNLLENKGFKVETRRLTLQVQYRQHFLGTSRIYTLNRERIFTAQAAVPMPPPPQGTEIPEN